MKTLDTKEWIAVAVSVFVIGFFFVFGQTLVSLLTGNSQQANNMQTQSQVTAEDSLIGGGEVASTGDRVTVHYTGKFLDGKVFDSSVTRGEPFQFVLGAGQVISGWEVGIVGMRVGGKRVLIIPPNFGYGMNDYGPIPGNSTLVFEVELLKVER